MPAKCIQSHRAKAASRETLSCLCFFVWVNTQCSLPSQPRCKMVRDCSHFWTICTSSADLKVGAVHELLRHWLWVHSGTSLHAGKTKVWNRSGVPPPGCAMLQCIAASSLPDAVVWRGDHSLPPHEQGFKVRTRTPSIRCCWIGFPPSRTPSRHGSCYHAARQHGRISSSEL